MRSSATVSKATTGTHLAHRGVKAVVAPEQGEEHQSLAPQRVLVRVGVGADHKDDRVAVGEWYACHVPEDEHPPKLLVEHVPCLGDHVLALGTSVHVQASREEHVEHAVGDVAKVLVLLDSAGERQKEQEHPGDADLGEHLEVDRAETRVESDTHEVVVHGNTGKTERLSTVVHGTAQDVNGSGHGERRRNGNGHKAAKVLNNPLQAVDASRVEDKGGDQGEVPRREGIALVWKRLIVERGNRETVQVHAGHDPGEEELHGSQAEIRLPCKRSGVRSIEDVLPHAVEERDNVVDARGVHELAVVVPEADPEVVLSSALSEVQNAYTSEGGSRSSWRGHRRGRQTHNCC